MRLILAKMPALDAALIRFDGWWGGLSRRERWMVGGLAALLGAVFLVYGLIKPIQSARASALADIRTYETLTARIRAAGTLSPAAAPRRQGPAASVVTGAANSFGLAATTQPITGGVRATIADGSYDNVMAWLADLSASSTLAVRRVSITRGSQPGRVAASVDFAE